MASVLPRRSKATGNVAWRVQFRIDGTMCSESFPTEKPAREFGRLVDTVGGVAARKVLAARRVLPADMPTLRDFTHTYLDEASGLLTGVEPGTRKGYRQAAERSFLRTLGEHPLDAITKADVGKWVAWQEAQPSTSRDGNVSAKTVRNYHAILSAILTSAVQEGKRVDNPAYKTRLSRGVRRDGVFLSPAEFTTLLHFIPERHTALVYFLAGTGCRWGEATAVTWADVNLHVTPPTVRIDKAWKKSAGGGPLLKHPKSSRSRRTISLTHDVLQTLGTPGEGFLFPGHNGNHLWYGRFRTSSWDPAVDKAMDRDLCAAEGLTPLRARPNIHDLRHSHASWLIAAGVPLTFVQARLGHESIQTTSNVYGHLQPEAHTQMSDTIAAVLRDVRPLRQLT